MREELIGLGDQLIKQAENLGADQVEVYLESSRKIEITIEKGLIRLAAEKNDMGCGIRLALGKQLGVSYVTSLLKKDLDQAAQDAINAARASVSDPAFRSFASTHSSYPNVKGLFDKDLDQIECEQAVELITRGVQASKEVSGKERNLIEGRFKAETKTRAIVNSQGVQAKSTDTKTDLEISSTIGIGEDQCSSFEEQESRTLSDIDPERIGEKSARNALELRGAKSVEGGDMPLILTPRALWAVFGTGLVRALDARQVQDGKSYLIDCLGAEIASSELEIIDNGLLSGGIGSRVFDAEGVPSQSTHVIRSGVLRSFLHDSYSSAKDRIENTGNATRKSYSVIPSINSSNLVVTPGNATLDEMISEMRSGVLCTFTFDRPNFVTGELSAMIMEGFLVLNGEISHALKNTLFGITMKDLLQKITQVGTDVEIRERVKSPSILVESAKITSGS